MCQPAQELTEHDFAIEQRGGEKQLQRASLAFFRNGVGQIGRSYNEDGSPLQGYHGRHNLEGEARPLRRGQRRRQVEGPA